ncbi:MAG: carboxypeptidase-like regulatory domain-containing protein [Proteobacteria bacterium]|nr:carboxypeptidase-like regulatory domain-containing protein [Pseudomonadota bacterium]
MRKSLFVIGGLIVLGTGAWYASHQSMNESGADLFAIDSDDIGGVVMGPNGPEAGVWVIAETNDLPTKFVRTVVTDEEGRYVLPDLPEATYEVWARGYGLLDSAKVEASRGSYVDIEQRLAPDGRAAAQIYPAIYWISLLEIPDADEFPGTGDSGNGISPDLPNQAAWLHGIAANCTSCHQLGSRATRELLPELGQFENSFNAWTRRIQSGQGGADMVGAISRLGTRRALEHYADWTDRIAAGELPFAKPARPQGVERNLVITQWDWSEPYFFVHDLIATDRRNPTVNAYGKLYGSPENSTDQIPILDPLSSQATHVSVPVEDSNIPTTFDNPIFQPSPYWGSEPIWDSHTVTHNPMMDHRGRVWLTSRTKPGPNPEFCREGSDHPSARLTPIDASGRDLSMYDPASGQWTLITTCFLTHHLNFTEDGTNTLWFSGGGVSNPRSTIGWFNTDMFEETGDEAASQGWTTFVLDTNGNGLRDANPVGPDDPVEPARDKIVHVGNYSVSVSPVDGSVWGSYARFPSGYVRVIPGDNPPETTISQFYEIPYYDENTQEKAHTIRGGDLDRNGERRAGTQSGHIVSFDIRKCQGPLNGPQATGRHCPEGWSFYEMAGPQYKNIQYVPGSADTSYFTWVDQFNAFGLGENVPLVIGNSSESLMAVVNEEVITLRVPYPLGFYVKGLDGRIDDPNAGWKGRGLWTTSGQQTPAHMETGKGTRPKVYHFQIRDTSLDH